MMSLHIKSMIWFLMAGVWLPFNEASTTLSSSEVPPSQCECAPPNSQPSDSYYRLGVAGEPDLFLPGELYTVSLHGLDSGQGPTPFVGFMIWAELDKDLPESENKEDPKPTAPTNQSLGTFQSYDAQTKSHDFCKPAVDNATAHPKTEIQVIWNAPVSAVELCVRLCARAAPVAGSHNRPASVLARKLCTAPAAPASHMKQPPIVEPCCACDEAKYEVTFEGLWSRNTHPREFPPETAQAHFGDIIGASHTAQYRVWQEGRVASTGLKRLAEEGGTTALEKELKAESDHIRTIIKARGITWQQVSSGGNPSTFAVFRVDARHHLVSLASKLAPSPDWIVGVSALELCNSNCTWTRSAMLPLFPYDVGTDSGLSYTSRRKPTIPSAPVRALRPDWPKDVRSPFFSTSGEMRPFARLRLTRLRLYEKGCEFIEAGGTRVIEGGAVSGAGACVLHEWGAWGPCSVTCGVGRASRQRNYVWPKRARHEACREPLTDHKRCYGPRVNCRVISEYEPEPAEASGGCAVSPWSAWSPCEGCGIRARTRHYVQPRAHKRCHVGFRARTVMSQASPCDAGPCYRPPEAINATDFDWFFVDAASPLCEVTSWSDWSPCSARCGRGRRLRVRWLMSSRPHLQPHLRRVQQAQWTARFKQFQLDPKIMENPEEVQMYNLTIDDPKVKEMVEEHLENCQYTLTKQEALCDGEDSSCEKLNKDVCSQQMEVGPCRSYMERWFYDSSRGTCEPFGYTGCGGNSNNFKTRSECQDICEDKQTTVTPVLITNADIKEITKKIRTTPPSMDNEVLQRDAPAPEDLDCETGPWLGWSECFGQCDFAFKLNYRLVTRLPTGDGKTCPALIKSRTCRPAYCHLPLLPATPHSTNTENLFLNFNYTLISDNF